MADYINKDILKDYLICVTNDTTCPIHISATIDQILDHFPDSETVSLVRCKDCKKFQQYNLINRGNGVCMQHISEVTEHSFCSYGEKREEKL